MPRLPDARGAARQIRARILRMAREERDRRPLWPGPAPGAVSSEPGDVPTCSVYTPGRRRPTRDVIVVFPGGGYVAHAEHEAAPVGRRFASAGVWTVVARYRLAPRYRYPAMLGDARQAIVLARARAVEWGLDGARVGVLGFSAGGHLAGMAALLGTSDPGCSGLCRPDFAILVYPVVRLVGEYAHAGVRAALLGDADESRLSSELSLDRRVGADAPPCFIVHGCDDELIDVRHSLALADAYRRMGRPCELHVFAGGRHGFGLGRRDSPAGRWPELCSAWLGEGRDRSKA